MKNLIIILLLISSCINNKDSQAFKLPSPASISVKRFIKTVHFEPRDLTNNFSLRSKLIKTCIEFNELKDEDIKNITLVDSANIEGFGFAQIYKIILSEDLPEVYMKENILVINKNKRIGVVFLLDSLFFVKKTKFDKSCLLAGVQKIKTRGYLKVFNFEKPDRFEEILNTLDYCENGIPIFNNDLECISYIPEMMKFENLDINNDNLLDIKLSGEIASYCEGLETGHGRKDRKPISITKVNLGFVLKVNNQNKKAYYEFLDKDRVCNLLKSYPH